MNTVDNVIMASSTQEQTFQCRSCPRSFATRRGLGSHQVVHNRHVVSPTNTAPSISLADTSAINLIIRASLPPFLPVNTIVVIDN